MITNKTKFDSSFKYNPLNPRNWRLFCKINVISSFLLILDFVIGTSLRLDPLKTSYLSNLFASNALFVNWVPIFIVLIILWISPWLNQDINDSPFFGALVIKVLLYLGAVQFSYLGVVVEYVLDLCCSIVIGAVLFFIVVLEIEEPFNSVKALIFGLVILGANFFMNLLLFGWTNNETWDVFFLASVSVGILAVKAKKELFGAVIILTMSIINNYFVMVELGGYGIGASIVSLTSIFVIIHHVFNL